MAVIYKSHDLGNTLLIGGASTTSGTQGGMTGPFPKFSVNREPITTGDGTYLGSKYSIEVTGFAVINPSDSQDITIKGERQSAVHSQILSALQMGLDGTPSQNSGILEISPYGGQPNTIRFNDARPISVSIPQQEDTSAGVQNTQYSFTFEAYEDGSANSGSGSPGSVGQLAYRLLEAEETWEISDNDAMMFDGDDPEGTLKKTYTITHSVSAKGLASYSGLASSNKPAWEEARLWVKSRLVNDPTASVKTDIQGGNGFHTDILPIDLLDGATADISTYSQYDHVRSSSVNIFDGTATATETWLMGPNASPATYDIDISIEDDKSSFINVTVSATFQGYTSNNATDTSSDKFDNANVAYGVVKAKFSDLALSAYNNAGYTDALRTDPISESIGENRTAGTITYSATYDDNVIELDGATSEDININYDNIEGLNEVIAKIPIIGKQNGPIIQDMDTTTIRSVQASLDAVMNKQNRNSPPTTNATSILDAYKPSGGKQQSKTEAWSPKTGTYNLSISWEFNS